MIEDIGSESEYQDPPINIHNTPEPEESSAQDQDNNEKPDISPPKNYKNGRKCSSNSPVHAVNADTFIDLTDKMKLLIFSLSQTKLEDEETDKNIQVRLKVTAIVMRHMFQAMLKAVSAAYWMHFAKDFVHYQDTHKQLQVRVLHLLLRKLDNLAK